jgi:hypothetical protein
MEVGETMNAKAANSLLTFKKVQEDVYLSE